MCLTCVSQVVRLPSVLRRERRQTVWADPEGRVRVWLSVLGRHLWLRLFQFHPRCDRRVWAHLLRWNYAIERLNELFVSCTYCREGHRGNRQRSGEVIFFFFFLQRLVLTEWGFFQHSSYFVRSPADHLAGVDPMLILFHPILALCPCPSASLQHLGQIIQLMPQPVFLHIGKKNLMMCFHFVVFQQLDWIILIILINCSLGRTWINALCQFCAAVALN